MRGSAGVRNSTGGQQPFRDRRTGGMERMKSARPPAAALVWVSAELEQYVDQLDFLLRCKVHDCGRIEGEQRLVDQCPQIGVLLEQLPDAGRIAAVHGSL